jgi:hypothetical protein
MLSVADSEITVSQEFTLSVTNVNDAPEITSTRDVTQINQGETFSYTVVVTDNDPDDEVTLTAPGLPAWMTFTPATGVLEGTPTNEQVGFSPDSTFDISIVATDKADATDTQEFTLTVININDAPEVVSQSTVTTDRNVDVDISIDDLTVNDPDHVFPTDHTFTILEGDDYSFSGNTITPENNFYGELSVNTEVSDGEDTTPYSFIITVNYVNIAPEFTSEPKTTGNEGSPYSYLIQVSDPDVDDPDIDQDLTITIVTKPNWLEFESETNILLGFPGRDDVGDNIVSIKVSDGEFEVFQNFTIVVISGNNAPVISTSPPLQVNNYSPYSYVISASDADPMDQLQYSAQLLPAWLSFDPVTQTLSGVPEKADVGQHTVILKVTDGYDDVLQEFIITVLDVNTAPVVTSSQDDVTVEIDKLYTYLLEVIDYEGDALIITPISLPDWLNYDQGSKVLSGTPTSADIDVHDVIFSITDGAFTILFDIDITVVTEISVDLQDAIVSNVYPVPASEFVIFEIQNQKGYNLEISDITGKVVYSYEIDPNTDRHRVDLAGMDKGIYIYRIYNDNEQQSGRLIVK